MSLPGGRYNQRVLAACRQAGYTQIFTSVPRAEQMPLGFLVGRLNVRGDMTLDRLRSVLQPGNRKLASLERQYRIKAAAKSCGGRPVVRKDLGASESKRAGQRRRWGLRGMKILHIISSGGMYGAEAVILNLSRTLNEGPHRSMLGVFSNSSNPNLQLHENATKEGIESYLIPCNRAD